MRASLSMILACVALAAAAPSVQAEVFQREVAGLFKRQCVACHATGEEQGNLALAPSLAWASLVNVRSRQADMPRVTPGQPARSYLLHKLRGTHLDHGGSGVRMPMGLDPLAPEDIARIEAWIAAGAPNN